MNPGRIRPRGRRWGSGSDPDPLEVVPDVPAVEFDDVMTLARRIVAAPRPLVLAFDVDGTLAPLAPHPSLSVVEPRVLHALDRLGRHPEITVAVVSGRPWHDLDSQFGLPASIVIVGSHGLELGRPGTDLSDDERRRSARLAMLAGAAAATAPGAWVEHKPAGVALHVRQAAAADAERAITSFIDRVASVEPVEILPGDEVVEVALRRYDKGAAVRWLRNRAGARTVVFVGDDATDEFGFAALESGDIGIKVGTAPTIAGHRVADPGQVAELVTVLIGPAPPP